MGAYNKYRKLVQKRIRFLLAKTDWMAANVDNQFTPQQVTEIKTYRQALRDMNKEYPDDHVKWVFPEVPTCICVEDLECLNL